MTDALTAPLPVIAPPRLLLTPLGDPSAAACDGDFCAIPDHHTQAVVNRKLDEDAV
ncbi:MAG: hypothetical protein ACKVOG_05585 [Rhodoglobus sp.]